MSVLAVWDAGFSIARGGAYRTAWGCNGTVSIATKSVAIMAARGAAWT
jgi:hypothetical protein